MYSYRSGAFLPGGPSFNGLAADFVTFFRTQLSDYQRAYFVSHSLGSALVMQCLSEIAAVDPPLIRKARGHVMIAPALWGSPFAQLSPSRIARSLAVNSPELEIVRTSWIDNNLGQRVPSVVLFGSSDHVVRRGGDDLLAMGISTESVPNDHVRIANRSNFSDASFVGVREALYQFSGYSPDDESAAIRQTVLLSEPQEWDYESEEETHSYMPDRRIQFRERIEERSHDSFREPWALQFPNAYAVRLVRFDLLYNDRRICDYSLVYTDESRYLIPLPRSRDDLRITHEQYRVGKILQSATGYRDLDSGLKRAGIAVIDEAQS